MTTRPVDQHISNIMSSSIPPGWTTIRKDSLSPLHQAALCPGTAEIEKVLASLRLHGSLEQTVNRKCSNADPRSGGYTPLHYACQEGNPGAVRLLLEAGADPQSRKNNGCTPLLSALHGAGYCKELQVKLKDYRECVTLLMDHPRFDLEANDSPRSPVYVAVAHEYVSPDVLLPLLLLLLLRGFDADGCVWGYSALHLALRMGHLKCAMALVRSGADIHKLAPKQFGMTGDENVDRDDKWSALEACWAFHGQKQAQLLEEAATGSNVVAGSKKRRNTLRKSSGTTEGVKKMAKKAMDAGTDLMKARRWKEAAGAYMEAVDYISQDRDSLEDTGRYAVLGNLSFCMLKLRRRREAVQYARQLVEFFPDQPGAMIVLADAIANPCLSRPSNEELKEAGGLSRKVKELIKTSKQSTKFDRLAGSKFKEHLVRAKEIDSHVAYWNEDVHSPALKAAQIAIDEYQSHGNYVKAAEAIDEALRPELNHPNPPPMQALKGSIYVEWGREILENNIRFKRSKFVPSESFSGEEPSPWTCAREKMEISLAEFQSALASGHPACPQDALEWNVALALAVLGRLNDAGGLALKSYSERLGNMLVNAGLTATNGTQAVRVDANPLDAISHDVLLFQLEMNLKMSTMFVILEALDATEADLANNDNPSVLPCLGKALQLYPSDASAFHGLLSQLDETSEAGVLWGSAVKSVEEGQHMLKEFRVEAAKVAVQSALQAKRRIRNASSRVVRVLLKEALFWDPNVYIPDELGSAHRRAAEPIRCGNCNVAEPAKNCPCGEAHYCCKECQLEDWKHHKKTCKHHKSNKAKKGATKK